jgi:hypothetical protein
MTFSGRALDRSGLPVSVEDAVALDLYDDAVDALLAGRPCRRLIVRCLARAPGFALAIACRALCEPTDWPVPGWPPATEGLTRRERQHLDVVAAVLAGDTDRATGLAAEHLLEFPGDRLVAALAEGVAPWAGAFEDWGQLG